MKRQKQVQFKVGDLVTAPRKRRPNETGVIFCIVERWGWWAPYGVRFKDGFEVYYTEECLKKLKENSLDYYLDWYKEKP